jgi:hypothetical protein
VNCRNFKHFGGTFDSDLGQTHPLQAPAGSRPSGVVAPTKATSLRDSAPDGAGGIAARQLAAVEYGFEDGTGLRRQTMEAATVTTSHASLSVKFRDCFDPPHHFALCGAVQSGIGRCNSAQCLGAGFFGRAAEATSVERRGTRFIIGFVPIFLRLLDALVG